MLGKINSTQEDLILETFRNLPKNKEYNIVHLGVGEPIPERNIGKWSREIHLAQCEKFTHPRNGECRRKIRKINVKYSDIWFTPEKISLFNSYRFFLGRGSVPALRSKEKMEGGETGKQEYVCLDATNIDLPDASVNFVIAVGLFSKYVFSIWNNLDVVISEIKRILLPCGEIFLTIREEYFQEFKDVVDKYNLKIVFCQSESDSVPELGIGGNRVLLNLKK